MPSENTDLDYILSPFPPQLVITTEQLAQICDVCPGTVRNWRFAGKGPDYFHVAGSKSPVLYRIESVRKWFNALEADENKRRGKAVH